MSDDGSLPLLGAGQSLVASLLAMMLRISSMVSLMVLAGAYKGSISGTSYMLPLGSSTPSPLWSWSCLLWSLGSPWCGFCA
jgi:hypothetical protein